MSGVLSDFADLLERCQGGIAAILRQSTVRAQWADRLAELLGQFVPSAAWSACLLNSEGAVCLAVRPTNDAVYSERNSILQSQLSSFDPLASGVGALSVEALPGHRVLVSAIHHEERPRGYLALGFTGATPQEVVTQAEALLTVASATVAQLWTVQTLQREQAELDHFALLGRSFIGLAHDLNNILNSMMLQTAMVQLHVEPQTRHELAAIRQHGAQAAELLRSLQHVVHQRREPIYPVELDGVLAEILEENATLRAAACRRACRQTRAHSSTRSTVKQFVRLLLEGVCAETKGTVSAATDMQHEGASLTLSIADPAKFGSEEDAPLLEAMLWQNLDEVGRQAGRSLLRQLGAALTVEQGSDGMLSLRVVWGRSP